MAEILITSDSHLNHINCAKWRGFIKHDINGNIIGNVDVHDELIIQEWNSIVSKKDVVYHIGDVMMNNAFEKIQRLNGIKHLILGNHDKAKNLFGYFNKVVSVYKLKNEFVLSHIPLHPKVVDDSKLINLHGHTHGLIDGKIPLVGNKYLNVNMEFYNFRPLPLEDIRNLIIK